VFEAHSTDYQTTERLTQLVEDHWAVLKVGPGLTFALREALFALATIEDRLVAPSQASHLVDVVEAVMLRRPQWWRGYYDGDDRAQAIARVYSYSDRLRYYWPDPEVVAAQDRLMVNLRTCGIPLPMLSAHLPAQYARVRAGSLDADPAAIAVDKVRDVLRTYATACTPAFMPDDTRSDRRARDRRRAQPDRPARSTR
jgi:D-tagatose-1,6-bisphosphate aldolase subunit GatZ/KbaZ